LTTIYRVAQTSSEPVKDKRITSSTFSEIQDHSTVRLSGFEGRKHAIDVLELGSMNMRTNLAFSGELHRYGQLLPRRPAIWRSR
jgi:hypothetical protein